MIFFIILLDIIISNYTNYISYFFINYLYNKELKYYILTGLTLDLIVFNTLNNTIILVIIYYINKIFKSFNKDNYYIYIIINIINYILYITITNVIMNNGIITIIMSIKISIIINIIYIILSYPFHKNCNN